MSETVICPKCHYENIVVSCGFCIQCGADFAPPGGQASTAQPAQPTDTDASTDARGPDRIEDRVDQIIRQVAGQANFDLQASAGRWRVQVPLDEGRRQNVLITLDEQDDDDDPVLRFLSMCGPAIAKHSAALLKINGQVQYCAFAVRKVGEREAIIVNATLPAGSADQSSIGKILRRVARHADHVEQRLLSGSDKY